MPFKIKISHYNVGMSGFDIKKTCPLPGVIYLKFKNQYETCATFMRLQEFYESPFKRIRGKHFSLETFMDLYAKQQGNFTYTGDWGGFNVPGHVVNDFREKFDHDMLAKERRLFDHIWDVDGTPPRDKYYVIGTYDERCLDHELAHAVYYLNTEYRKVANKLVKALSPEVQYTVTHWLLDKGYSKSLIADETNAYLATTCKDELKRWFGKDVVKEYKTFKPLRDAFELYTNRKLPTATWILPLN